MRQTCIFSGSSHPRLVEEICDRLGQKPANVDLRKFSNGETSVEIRTSVRDQDVFIVQSGSSEINDSVMELLIMISACKGGSSRSITAVVPYFPYSRQSKKKTHRGAITARMLANLMKVAGVNHVITIDLHASQSQGFFKCPVDNLMAQPLIAKWIPQNIADWENSVVVSKNAGGSKRVTSLADRLNLSFGIVTTDRRRNHVPSSLYNSVILEANGTDGIPDRRTLEMEDEDAETQILPMDKQKRSPRHLASANFPLGTSGNKENERLTTTVNGASQCQDFEITATTVNDPSRSPRQSHQKTRGASQTPPKVTSVNDGVQAKHDDDDGYEEPEGEDDEDESVQDVTTGRLIQGHIVDDDDSPSPQMSARSSDHIGTHRTSSEEELPEQMERSFISIASSRMPTHGLGGTGDATASDEEEEEALQNPDIESTVTLVGNVRDRPVLIVDDIIDKAGSWIAAAETVVKRGGATKVYCIATHGLFGGNSLRELDECDEIEAVVVTNAFPIPEEKRLGIKKLHIIDVSGLLAEAIRRNHHGESISQLYQYFD